MSSVPAPNDEYDIVRMVLSRQFAAQLKRAHAASGPIKLHSMPILAHGLFTAAGVSFGRDPPG
jgi:hypothetical protein